MPREQKANNEEPNQEKKKKVWKLKWFKNEAVLSTKCFIR